MFFYVNSDLTGKRYTFVSCVLIILQVITILTAW